MPPYQLSDGGGTGSSATPLYQRFVQQAKKLNPRYLSMIIPARWYSGGKGLDDFRATMLTDKNVRVLVDYDNFREVFPGVDLAGYLFRTIPVQHSGDTRSLFCE